MNIVKDAMTRMANRFNKPPEPIMSQEEYDSLPYIKKCILICNVIGCGDMVSTHGMLCTKHTVRQNEENTCGDYFVLVNNETKELYVAKWDKKPKKDKIRFQGHENECNQKLIEFKEI